MSKSKVIVILGPTATGKSDLAVFLAKKYNGEVVSADSRQVYKGLDIGTGKITKKEMLGVKHYLLDIVNPKKTFTAEDFKQEAVKKIEEIIKKNKVPIICGGTGFYISLITENLELPKVKANLKLRKKLENVDIDSLIKILKDKDEKILKRIDLKNKRKIIRAIEIIEKIGYLPEIQKGDSFYDFLKIGLKLEKEKLKEKIEKRIKDRIKIGMIKEAENLHKSGLSYKRMNELGLEYRFLAKLLKKEISKEEFENTLFTKINQYAKRQITWFKRDKEVVWFDPNERRKIDNEVKKYLKKKEN